MNSHLDIELRGRSLVLPDDFSIQIEERNPLFYDVEMFSLPVQIPLKGNRELMKNIETPEADMRATDLEYEPVRIKTDGMPHKSGTVRMTNEEDIRESLTLNVDQARQSFDDLIGDLECRDVPLKDRIQIGEKIGNVKVKVKYSYKVNVHFRSGKKDEWTEYPFASDDEVTGTFEPQALGFSYPGICVVEGSKQKAKSANKDRTYLNGNTVVVPQVQTSFINVTDAYPEKPYCNARIAYLHHGLNDDGTTSDSLPRIDQISSVNEDRYPYWCLDADRPQSGLCFYVLYFLECLFQHLGVSYDLSALTAIEDMKHLCFFTTLCKYDVEPVHGTDANPFFQATTATGHQSQKEGFVLWNLINPKVWNALSEDDFNTALFSDINQWLTSRGCGGQFVLAYPEPKQVQDFEYQKNGGQTQRIVVGQGDVESIKIEANVTWASVSANIMAMYANSDNFPEVSVSEVLSSLEASFGIRFNYDYEQKKVTAYLLRDVFRQTASDTPIPFRGKIKDMYKVTEKTTGIRMAYSAESDSKEQRKNVLRGVKDYDTDYDYIDYPQASTVTNLTYEQILREPQVENLKTYIDRTTGNTYRFKTSKDALESGEYKISLLQVATFKGVEIGDCSKENGDNVQEFISSFEPVPFNDVNYRISQLMVSGEGSKTISKDGNTYTISHINQDYEPMLSAFVDVDMEHEFVPQYIRNALPSGFVDIYLTEQLKLVESYDPSQTDDGNSPLQELDWGMSIALMQGGGTNATIQTYDYNYDGMGNSRWRRVAGKYALTSDSMDMNGTTYDYNGDRPDDGGGERFSLKIRSWQQPAWADSPICADDVVNQQGRVVKKIRTRGLCDSFMMEYFHFLLYRKKFKVEVQATAADLADIINHWKQRYRINGQVGWIGKVNYDITRAEGIRNAVLEFYSL